MATRTRFFGRNQLQFITASTYRRARLFESARLAEVFVAQLQGLRLEFGFRLYGWVLMPEHFHLLLKCEPDELTSRVIQQLKQRTAARILRTLRAQPGHAWCRRMLERLRLPETVHDGSHFRVWQRRFYPFGVYSQKKLLEKLTYMHNNPVKRGLVQAPGDWPWSSWRAYCLEDASVLTIDRLP
jgi:putative transposase